MVRQEERFALEVVPLEVVPLEVVLEQAGELLGVEQAPEVDPWAWTSFSEQGFALRF